MKMEKLKSVKKYFLAYWRLCWKIGIPISVFLILIYFLIFKDLPSPTKLASPSLPQSTQIFDRNDKLLYTIYSKKNRTFVRLSAIPKHLQYATIAVEDKDFYRHGAIDIRGIARSF